MSLPFPEMLRLPYLTIAFTNAHFVQRGVSFDFCSIFKNFWLSPVVIEALLTFFIIAVPQCCLSCSPQGLLIQLTRLSRPLYSLFHDASSGSISACSSLHTLNSAVQTVHFTSTLLAAVTEYFSFTFLVCYLLNQ